MVVRAFVTNPLMLCEELFYSFYSTSLGAKLESKTGCAISSEAHHVAVQIKQSPAKITRFGNEYLLTSRINGIHAGLRWNNGIYQQFTEQIVMSTLPRHGSPQDVAYVRPKQKRTSYAKASRSIPEQQNGLFSDKFPNGLKRFSNLRWTKLAMYALRVIIVSIYDIDARWDQLQQVWFVEIMVIDFQIDGCLDLLLKDT
jgi:hypothetical protein